jgi:hypothetical protein
MIEVNIWELFRELDLILALSRITFFFIKKNGKEIQDFGNVGRSTSP